MKCPRTLLVAAGLLLLAAVNSLAGEVKVIANSSVKADAISAADLKRVFLEEKKLARGWYPCRTGAREGRPGAHRLPAGVPRS